LDKTQKAGGKIKRKIEKQISNQSTTISSEATHEKDLSVMFGLKQ